jgi:diguanylate cyclase (GGDEF)-like protein
MNIRLLPDLVAMAALLAILFFLRRRHPQERVGLWMVGLLFIFLEAIAHTIYRPSGRLHLTSHVVALDSYLAAGLIFLWAASKSLFPRRETLFYLLVNAPSLAALLTIYSLDIRTPGPYRAAIAIGATLAAVSPFLINRTLRIGRAWWLGVPHLLIWGPAWFSVSEHHYRDAAYFPLFVIYLSTAVIFYLSLPRKSLGKICVVAGFTIWSLVFLFHSWVTDRPQYIDVANDIWNMQKFLVTMGMLMVLLEIQVASNEWYGFHDQLTGLPNRRFFEDRLAQALQHSEQTGTRTALIMIDLNGFKLINDSLGHDVGDRLLQHIAHSLRHAIRTPDVLARLGGDEFIIIVSDLPAGPSAKHIMAASEARIAEALRKPFTTAGHTLNVNGSVGVSLYPDDTTDEVLLRRLADQRMYEQKRQIPLEFEQAAPFLESTSSQS